MEVEFGFVPKQVVSDLQDIGNWKSRASAIDNLHKALHDVGDKTQLLPGLPRFVAFLVTLVADPNFKIAISSMQILCDLVAIVGPDIEPHLRSIIPNLLEKFTDSKALVRSANFKVLRNLVHASQPKHLVDLLGAGMTHSNWRVREEVINTLIMVMLLPGSRDGLNYAGIFRLLSMAVADPKERVKAVGLEGMAVLARCTGRSEVSSLLAQGGVGLGSEACAQVNSRLANPDLPSLGADGVVQHIMEPGPDTLDSISSDLPPTRRMGLAPLQQAQPRPFPLHQLPLPQPLQPPMQQQGVQQLPLVMSLQHGKLPWQAPAMPRPRLRPEAVTVKHVGLEGTAGSPGTLGNNGGAQTRDPLISHLVLVPAC
ncbi:armadillo-type protein [Dunaliella salina]|uniref:Armadillo-type protein n=1 Tax=Dunaliella salina TaxID=3046 RepID=A0ABQ7GFM7_DUNSA|nr:armadillo-type protein [Dunaliella salina]|eukprot:KAF5833410.1 armadillo-type protein [Dunaliella salina]